MSEEGDGSLRSSSGDPSQVEPVAHVVKVNPTLRALGQSVTLMQKLLGWTGLVVFGALALLVWWIALTNPDERNPAFWIGGFFMIVAGLSYVLIHQSRRHANLRKLLDMDVVFTITDTTLEFPEVAGHRPAETWRLDETRTQVRLGRGGYIAFTNPAKEPRRILQQGITEPVEEVQRRIMEAQRKLHRAKD